MGSTGHPRLIEFFEMVDFVFKMQALGSRRDMMHN